jgi:anthranilate synthase component 1
VITELEFKSLSAQGYNRIPLMVEAFADLETPLSLYLKLAFTKDGGKHSFLLESVVGGERFGRYSFIGLPARTLLRANGFGEQAHTEVVTDGVVVETNHGNPLDFIANYQQRFKVALRPGMPRFCGGLAGYFGYDTVRHIEKKLQHSCPPDTMGCPDILLLQTEELAVIDNLSGKLYLMVYADPAAPEAYTRAKKRLRDLKDMLKYSVSAPVVKATQSHPPEREFAKADYLNAVERAKRLIEAGDFMQVQVGQRIKKRFTESPLSLYRALRSLNPSPYMFCIDFPQGFALVGSSPEVHVKCMNGRIDIRPIAGTRWRGKTTAEDDALAQELLNDPKERAEHIMLVDLARNDVGRVADYATVRVSDLMIIERYSHVMHIVSEVEGLLDADRDVWDLLMASFPAGTVSGAPKIRAMQLIHALEPDARGPYSGVYGAMDLSGALNTAITIRTMVVLPAGDGRWRVQVQAGAGVVADSRPDAEYQETLNKARGMLKALACLA